MSSFKRHLLPAIVSLASVALWELAVIYLNWPISLSVPFAILSFSIYKWSGLRGALLAAFLVSMYSVYRFDWYGWLGSFFIWLGAFGIAAPSGHLKRVIRELAIKAEHYRLKAIDTFNGNRKKMQEALEALDIALASNDIIEIKKQVQIARIKQADTLTLVDSWHEMAKDKGVAIEKLDQAKRESGSK